MGKVEAFMFITEAPAKKKEDEEEVIDDTEADDDEEIDDEEIQSHADKLEIEAETGDHHEEEDHPSDEDDEGTDGEDDPIPEDNDELDNPDDPALDGEEAEPEEVVDPGPTEEEIAKKKEEDEELGNAKFSLFEKFQELEKINKTLLEFLTTNVLLLKEKNSGDIIANLEKSIQESITDLEFLLLKKFKNLDYKILLNLYVSFKTKSDMAVKILGKKKS